MDDSTKGRCDMILVWDLWIELGLNLKFYEHVIESDDGPFKGSTTPIANLGTYVFEYLNIEKITPGEYFTNAYVKEVYK